MELEHREVDNHTRIQSLNKSDVVKRVYTPSEIAEGPLDAAILDEILLDHKYVGNEMSDAIEDLRCHLLHFDLRADHPEACPVDPDPIWTYKEDLQKPTINLEILYKISLKNAEHLKDLCQEIVLISLVYQTQPLSKVKGRRRKNFFSKHFMKGHPLRKKKGKKKVKPEEEKPQEEKK
jgi:hypothetical protein